MSQPVEDQFAGRRLVVFGAGYLGGEIVRQALARRMRATALTRNAATAAALQERGAEVVVADLAAADWHAAIPGDADFVLNAVSSGGGGPGARRHSYVDGMRSILQWARARGPAGTLVYTSSTSVYPQGGGERVDEEAATDGTGERGAILLEAENLLRADAAASRRRFVLRLAGLYGPGRTGLLEQVRAGKIAGRGEQRLNLVHRDDACAAIWAAFGAPDGVAGGIFNVADDGAAPKAGVAAWLAQRLGVAPPEFTAQPLPGRAAVTPDRVIANDRIKRVLGWRPRHPTFREGYENVLAG